MAERAYIPTSPACGQWERLLAEALDGLLQPADESFFSAHLAVCPGCTELFEEARRGREWLGFLTREPEIPAGLLDKILAQTGPGKLSAHGFARMESPVSEARPGAPTSSGAPASVPAGQYPGFMSHIRRVAEPRLMMTAAMAFFSIAMTLNLTGVRLRGVRISDLRPEAIRSVMERRLTMASTPLIRYYDHLPLVYEVQSTVRELRKTTGQSDENNQQPKPQNSAPGESRRLPGKTNGQPRNDAPQLSGDTLQAFQDRPAHSGGSRTSGERGTVWIA